MEPRRPFLMTSPSVLVLEGSPTRHHFIFSFLSSRYSTTFTVPSVAGPSSSLVIRKPTEPLISLPSAKNSSQAQIMAAMLLFMSAAPRPVRISPSMVGWKGSLRHCSTGPVGTTSVCPAKTNSGSSLPRRAHRLSTSPKRRFSMRKPSGCSLSAMIFWQPRSSGVTEGMLISWRARSSVREAVITIGLPVAV